MRKKSRVSIPMSAENDLLMAKYKHLIDIKSHMKLQNSIRSLCMVSGAKVCQKSQTWSTQINDSIKETSERTPRL